MPQDYLEQYYSHIDSENHHLLEFFADAYGEVKGDALMLEFGGGPTVYQLISAAKNVKEIHFSDYLDRNLAEVKKWHTQHPDAFDWSSFVERVLKIEGQKQVRGEDIKQRQNLVRTKLKKFVHGNAFKKDPLGPSYRSQYDVIGVHFVPEGITASKATWKQALQNIVSLLKSNGLLVWSTVLEAEHWQAGKHKFLAVSISEQDIKETLGELGFKSVKTKIIPAEVTDPDAAGHEGYQGIIFVKAIKK